MINKVSLAGETKEKIYSRTIEIVYFHLAGERVFKATGDLSLIIILNKLDRKENITVHSLMNDLEVTILNNGQIETVI